MSETINIGEVDWNTTAVQYIELNKQKTEAIQRVRELIKNESWEDSDSCKVVAVSELLEALDGDTDEQE